MIRKRINLKLLVCIVTGFSLTSACNKYNCDGYDHIYEKDGLEIKSLDTLEMDKISQNGKSFINLGVSEIIKTTKGDRKCRQKDLAINNKNSWDISQFTLHCNRDIILNGKKMVSETNLLKNENAKFTFDELPFGDRPSSVAVLNIDSLMANQTYQFTIAGKTSDNKSFTGTKIIYLKK